MDRYAGTILKPIITKLALYERLPPELRELVYEYIYAMPPISRHDGLPRVPLNEEWDPPTDQKYTGPPMPDSAWLNPAVVGLGMAHEGTKIYY